MKAVFKGQKVGWKIVLPDFSQEGYKISKMTLKTGVMMLKIQLCHHC